MATAGSMKRGKVSARPFDFHMKAFLVAIQNDRFVALVPDEQPALIPLHGLGNRPLQTVDPHVNLEK